MSGYSEFANAISSLERDRGAALAQGQANAANIWGQTVGSFAQLPGQLYQLQQQQKAIDAQKQAGQLLSQMTTTGPGGATIIDPNKLAAMPAQLAATGMKPDQIEAYVKPLADMNDSIQKFRAAQVQHQQDMAGYVLNLHPPGEPVTPGTALAAVKLAQANGMATSADVDHFMAAINQGVDPRQYFTAVRDYGKQPEKPVVVPRGGTLATPEGRVLATGQPPAPTEAWLAADAATQGTPGETPTAAASAAALQSLQTPAMAARQTAQDAQAERVRHDKVMEQRAAQGGSGFMGQVLQNTDPKAIADAIQGGTMPPDIGSYSRYAKDQIASELAKRGFNLAQAMTDWKATQRFMSSMNGAQQVRLRQSIAALPDLLDSVDQLAAQWKAGRFPVLNKANLALAKNGALGKDAASIATQLDNQIAEVTADLGNVYMGGNSPTDTGLNLASKALNANWDERVLHDAVSRARTNVQIRLNSLNNVGVAGAGSANPYAPPPANAAQPSSAPQFTVGQTVSVGGKRVTITAIHPDGTFDGTEVK